VYQSVIGERQISSADLHGPARPSVSLKDEPVRNAHSHWPELVAVLAFAATVWFTIVHHEPWADDAQAWQLARSLSLRELFQTYIRYEASPGLWHFLLWILIRVHVSYAGLHWICGGIAVAATALLVFKSPFPRYLKLMLPFTFFLVFQYAVVARSYVLVPPILYLIATRWKKSPIVIALLLSLLANLSLHAAVLSGGVATVFFLEHVRTSGLKGACKSRQLLCAAPILIGMYSFALWTAWPPHDLMAHIAATRVQQSNAFLVKFLSSIFMGICRPWILAVPFWIVIALWLSARKSLFYLIPVLLFAIFSGEVSVGWWHGGLLIPLLTSLLWITWPNQGALPSGRETAGRIVFAMLAGLQITWAIYAVEFDYRNPYASALATSQFLRPLIAQRKTIALTSLSDPYCDAYHAVGILPYFDENIFVNMPYPFWLWSDGNPTEKLFDQALLSRPSIIVVEGRSQATKDVSINMKDPKIDLLSQSGYRMTNMFCGVTPAPERYDLRERTCDLVFQHAE
jgi:hypothetical protein